ncbi:hypothetical protein L1887_31632 [Cichorium endivia]|nr:hypothetical protein L1887_31632 [Cichorium endivia]
MKSFVGLIKFGMYKIKENQKKIILSKQLPYLVGNIVEVVHWNCKFWNDPDDDGANIDHDSQRKGKCVVLKTSTRQTIFLFIVGLVDLVGKKKAYYDFDIVFAYYFCDMYQIWVLWI